MSPLLLGSSRITRRVGFAENMDGIAGHEPPADNSIGMRRKGANRERTDDIKGPARYEFHQVLAAKAQFLKITGYSE